MSRHEVRDCRLVYQMEELGERVFNMRTDNPHKEAERLMAQYPPDATVHTIVIQTRDMNYLIDNKSFTWDAYHKAVEEKRWRDEYFRRTGKQWSAGTGEQRRAEAAPEIDTEDAKLDYESCLKLFRLKPDFSKNELKQAYREAVSMNHPDKVAALSEEFKILAERKTKRINEAYSRLLKKI